MGILGDDELIELDLDRRAQGAKNVTPSLANRFGGQSADGFNQSHVKQIANGGGLPMDRINLETGEFIEQKSGAISGASERSAGADQTSGRSHAGRTSTNSSSSISSSQGDDGQPSGSTSSSRAPAGTFQEFSMALLRFGGTGNGREADVQKIGTASEAFWKENGGKPDHRADVALSKAIIGVHLKRMAGEATLEAAKAEVAKTIDASFNGL
jgi:hypothetical protein